MQKPTLGTTCNESGETHAKTIVGDAHLVGVFLIELVLNLVAILLVELIRWYLHQVGEGGLRKGINTEETEYLADLPA